MSVFVLEMCGGRERTSDEDACVLTKFALGTAFTSVPVCVMVI